MASNITVDIPQAYADEMNAIKKNISSFNYQAVASSLGKFTSQEIVAGLIGCIIPESGSNHTILMAKEFRGGGAAGTYRWNCGEGLIQWTYWKYKLPLIKLYNADSRSTQKLPTTWDEYNRGEPIAKGNSLYAAQDGRHIAGLTLDNQMLFLTIYYGDLIKQLQGVTNLAVIVAKIYQQKAGIGFYRNISDPIERAYTTSKNKYPSSAGNHYLQSLKVAQQYLNAPVTPSSVPVSEYTETNTGSSSSSSTSGTSGTPVTPKPITSMQDGQKSMDGKGKYMGVHLRQK